MTLFQEGNTVSNNKLIFHVALKTIIIKQQIQLQTIHTYSHNIYISQSEYNVIIIRYFVLTLHNLYIF